MKQRKFFLLCFCFLILCGLDLRKQKLAFGAQEKSEKLEKAEELPAGPPLPGPKNPEAQKAKAPGETPKAKSKLSPDSSFSGQDYSLIREMRERAENHYFQKRYHVALRLFLHVIEKDPENYLAYRYAGDIFLLQKKLKEAKEHFLIARELSRQPQEEWLRLAQVYILSKEKNRALEALRKALKFKPDFSPCYFYLGLVYYKLFHNKQKTIENWEIYKTYVKGEEKRKIERALEILKQKDYVIPYKDHPEKFPYGE